MHMKPREMNLFANHLAGKLQSLKKLHLSITRRQDDHVGNLIKELTGNGRQAGTKSKQGDKQQEAQEQKLSNWGRTDREQTM